MLPMVFATGSINNAETTIVLEGSTAEIQSNIQLSSEGIGNLTLILSPDSRNVEITIDDKKIECLLQAEFARCGNVSAGAHNLSISYETDYPVAESGENTLVRYTDHLPYPANQQQVTLQLPVGYIIPREKGKDESFYISPEPTEVYSDGQRVILYWEQEGQELPISVVARKVIGPPIGWMGATLLSVLVAGTAILFVLRKGKKEKPKPAKKKTVIVPTLIDNEQKVVNFLKENGEVWQKQIQQATGFSKAKVSRVVRNLETRGVIVKIAYGNTNKISLKK